MLKFVFITLFGLIAVEAGVVTDLDACNNDTPLPDSVDVSGCTSQPCPLIKGSDVQLILNFTAPYELDGFNVTVRASFSIISINYNLPDPVGCNNLINTRCPLEKSEPGSYRLIMPVNSAYPTISNLRLRFSLIDPEAKSFACFVIRTSVMSA
ncbi:NPC intracellular cholesterol transporter 2-like [Agrilus planipennis]|uniref:NPC intracellular cholesterol transporter 2-like n=1 Tax=Agrilus planipennis TaxID=224129 RepID=A0A1W4XU71_AGRPL|nr:NPC intracellular cholesterol transporter 2-like [Agrilus planipennis]